MGRNPVGQLTPLTGGQEGYNILESLKLRPIFTLQKGGLRIPQGMFSRLQRQETHSTSAKSDAKQPGEISEALWVPTNLPKGPRNKRLTFWGHDSN